MKPKLLQKLQRTDENVVLNETGTKEIVKKEQIDGIGLLRDEMKKIKSKFKK